MNSRPTCLLSQGSAFIPSRVRDYWELTKPRLVALVLLSTMVGFYLASAESLNLLLLLSTMAGTFLVAEGAMALNEWMEREEDAKMARTAARPLPQGRIEPKDALLFGTALIITGVTLLLITVNRQSAFLAALTVIFYLLFYTPLKKRTELCTLVGALPGALPPLIGWSAASAGTLSLSAWILFFILFLWQMPHFLAVGWMYRGEYAQAGFQMLSVTDKQGGQVGRQIVLYSFALLPVSLLPSIAGMTGWIYFIGSLTLGIFFIALGLKGVRQLDQNASPIFRGSIFYLACLLTLMMIDKL